MAMKNVVVLMKQVPDVRIAGEDVLLPDGSINRAILPAIVNPNDFYALQQALLIKDNKFYEVAQKEYQEARERALVY